MADCVFCDIVAGELPATNLDLRDHGPVVTFVPLNPVAEGHILVVPKRHVPDAVANPGVSAQAMRVAAKVAQWHGAANIITSIGAAATQTVFHMHIHVVPRVEGDGLVLPWTFERPPTDGDREALLPVLDPHLDTPGMAPWEHRERLSKAEHDARRLLRAGYRLAAKPTSGPAFTLADKFGGRPR